MAMKSIKRLESRIRQIASERILHHLNDPRIGFVTVTGVKLLTDLSRVTISVSVLGDDSEINKTMRALKGAASSIQRTIAGALPIRTVPHVTFAYDETVARSFEMDDLIQTARASDTDGGIPPADEGAELDGAAADGVPDAPEDVVDIDDDADDYFSDEDDDDDDDDDDDEDDEDDDDDDDQDDDDDDDDDDD
ncbi:MAG: 30S ribosome-binding factor RbfA [Planctomycetota bacterium]